MADQVASPTYDKTPVFNNNSSTTKPFNRKKKKTSEVINDEDWEAIRNFQKTELIKSEGIQKDIDSIRSLINRITEKTYDLIIEKLTEKLDSFEEAIFEGDNFSLWFWWGIAIAFHTYNTFSENLLFMNKNWEDKKIKEYMDEK